MVSTARSRRAFGACLLAIATVACAHEPIVGDASPPRARGEALGADTFAIYASDDATDITREATDLPPGFEIFHERDAPKTGYVFAALDGVSQVEMLARLRDWSATRRLPARDAIFFGKTTDTGVRTYVLERPAIVDTSDISGAMALPLDPVWGVALTFTDRGAEALGSSLSQQRRFRIVLHGFVESDRFELDSERTWTSLPGAHRSLSTREWACSGHRAVLRMSARHGVSAKERATALASLLPPFRDGRQCHEERLFPRR